MKKYFLIIATALCLSAAVPCHAQPATANEAKIVAQTYLGRDTTQVRNRVARVTMDNDRNGTPLMYEVIMNDSTIVLVSGSKATNPILATYKEATGIFETNNLPCGLSVLVDFYREAIAFVDENNVRGEINDEWKRLLNRERPQPQRVTIGPFLTTRWGQSYSNDSAEVNAYNMFTPDICTGGRNCLAGCVAVAMGQVMNYYRHPIITYKPNGFSEQYDWCHMPDVLTSQSPLFEHECEAVSRLLFECGEMADMQYGCTASETNNDTAKGALISYFGYSQDAQLIKRNNYLYAYYFRDRIKANILGSRPVIIGARDRITDNLHSFVCDGYKDDNLFHFNWGWNGYFNGFYSFLFNIDIQHADFNQDFDAIVYIRPDENQTYDICDWEMHLENFYTDFYSNDIVDPITYPPYYNTPKTTAVLYSADISSDEDWRTIPAYKPNPIEYRAHTEIHLQNGFTAEYGCDFTATIDPCEECEERNYAGEVIGETDVEFGEAMPDMAAGRPSIATEGLREETVLYPNPTDGELTIGVDGEVQSIVIYNAIGRPIGGWNLRAITPDHVTLDLTPLPRGSYIVRIHTPMGTASRKLILQ